MSEVSQSEGCSQCAPIIAALRAHNEQLEKRVAQLETKLAELSASRGSGKGDGGLGQGLAKSNKPKKRPGRKPGRGRFSYRLAPSPEELSGPPQDVPLSAQCDHCSGELQELGTETLYHTELPELPRPIVTAFVVHRAVCRSCGRYLRSSHPLLPEDQTGATAHRIGHRAAAMALALHYEVGVPQRRVPRVLELLGGVRLSQSAIAQAAKRQAKGAVGKSYEALRAEVRKRPVTYTDDTSWPVGGDKRQLMVFDTDHETVYQVRAQHRNEEIREIVPADYHGVLVSDRAPAYDAKELSEVDKQKCLWHALGSIKEVLELKEGKTRSFGKRLKVLLKQAVRLHERHRKGRLTLEQYLAEGQALHAQVAEHLRPRRLSDKDNQRLLDELGWQLRQGSLLRFLQDPTVEPTNNRSERALKPPIIARKVSQGSKTEGGAYAMSAFRSVIQTFKKRGIDVIEGLMGLFQGQRLEALHPT